MGHTIKLKAAKWPVLLSAIVAVLFGLLTIFKGGQVLFVGGEARAAAGNYVPFILWFNFLAGFFYVIAGAGLWLRQVWAARLSFAIAIATMFAFAALGAYILTGGAYELRTLGAMALRCLVWVAITLTTCRLLVTSR